MLESIVLFILIIVTYTIIVCWRLDDKVYEIQKDAIKHCEEHGIELTIAHNEFDRSRPYALLVRGIRIYTTDIHGLVDLHYDYGIEWLTIKMYPMLPKR